MLQAQLTVLADSHPSERRQPSYPRATPTDDGPKSIRGILQSVVQSSSGR